MHQGDKKRPIINGKEPNWYQNVRSFKINYIQNLRTAVRPNDWGTSVDIKDMFLHAALGRNMRLWSHALVYTPDGKARILCVLSVFFGTKGGPFVFQYLMNRVNGYFGREHRTRVPGQMDDYVPLRSTMRDAIVFTLRYVRFLVWLGWIVHEHTPKRKKTCLTPRQTITALGATINTKIMFWAMKREKARAMTKALRHAYNRATAEGLTVRDLQSLQGDCAWAATFSAAGRQAYAALRDCLRRHLKRRSPAHKRIPCSRELRRELKRLRDGVSTRNGVSMTTCPPHIFCAKDASQIGAGGVVLNMGEKILREHLLQIFFSKEETAKQHINEKEIRATVDLTVAIVQKYDIRNVVIAMLDDNTTSVNYFNKQGGRKRHLSRRAVSLIRWLLKRNIILVSIYIHTSANKIADFMSRMSAHAVHNWSLRRSSFRAVERILCPEGFDIDCFAAAGNARCPKYFAFYLDPWAQAHNFFEIDLRTYPGNLYCFPPPSLIADTLQQLVVYGRQATLVVPAWTDQTWFVTLMQGAIATPLILDMEDNHFVLPHGLTEGMSDIQVNWNFVACRFSPRSGDSAAFRSEWSRECAAKQSGIEDMMALGRISQRSATTRKLTSQISKLLTA